MTGSPLFSILVIASTAIFAGGLLGNLLFWLQGNSGAGVRPASDGLVHLAGSGLKGLSNGSVWKSLLLDSALQRRLWRLSRLRWLMQMGFIWGTTELFFVGSMGNMLSERGILPLTKDTPLFATLNDLGALFVLLSVGIALYRRFVAGEIALSTSFGDVFLVALLATTVLSGILAESVRFLFDGVSPEIGGYSFIGYSLAQVMRPLASDWSGANASVWWIHIVLSFSLVAYLPYSKLFHLFVSPMVLAAGTLRK